MKTIVRKSDNVSLYLYPDDKEITLESNRTVIGPTDNPELYISDCNSSNVDVHTGVDNKEDYWGHKYKHDGSSWSDNSSFKGAAKLTSDITATINELPVLRSNPFLSSGTVKIKDEQITYTGINGNSLIGCTRGANSTTATVHYKQDLVEQI